MARLSSLPKELRYLEPFRKQASGLKPEEIDESMDLTLLNQLLCGRIQGLSIDDGKKLLKKDRAGLEAWLSSPDLEDNSSMFFLRGYLMALPELVDRLLEEKGKPQELEEIEMEFPPEARVKKRLGGGVIKTTLNRITFFAIPVDKDNKEEFLKQPQHHLAKVKVSPVAFGSVIGYKRLIDMSIVESMQAEYSLGVPGGWVSVTLLKKGTTIDESVFEQFFHTIRIVRR